MIRNYTNTNQKVWNNRWFRVPPNDGKGQKKLVKVGHSQAKAPRTRVSTRQEQVPSPQDSIFFHDWNLWKWARWAWNVRHTVHTPLPGHCFFRNWWSTIINHLMLGPLGALPEFQRKCCLLKFMCFENCRFEDIEELDLLLVVCRLPSKSLCW